MADRGSGSSRKRKREAQSDWFARYGDAPTPPRLATKRPAVPPANREQVRQELKDIYAAYDALFRGVRDGTAQDEDYQALLKAAEGSAAAKRLAARLLPKYLPHFPKHARAAGDVLVDLSRLSLSEPAAADTRRDALAGLPAVVGAAKEETDHQAVIKLVNFAFKQLQSLPAASLPSFAAGSTPNGQTPSALTSKGNEPLWALLEAAFTHFPRVVLAACIHALKKPGDNPQLFTVATHFVGGRLLAPHASGEAAGGDPPNADGGLQQQQQEEAGGASLFKHVMVAEEREQRWFRQHVQQFLQELPPSGGADACVVLQQLVKELPSSPRAQRAQQQQQHSALGKAPRREDGDDATPSASKGTPTANGKHARRTFSDLPPPQLAAAQQQQLGSPSKRGGAPGHLHAAASMPAGGAAAAAGGLGSPSRGTPRFGRSFDEGPPSTSYAPPGSSGRPDSKGISAMEVDMASPRGAVPQPPPPFPTPGENVCLAAACLWMAGLPAYLDESDVVRECSRHARVASAVLPPPVAGEVSVAYVVFPSVRDASRCYEGLSGAAPWRGCRPLDIRWCSSDAYPLTAPAPAAAKPCTHAWVAGVASMPDEGEVMRCCKDAGVPAPELLLRVGGRHQGLLLSFASEAGSAAAVQALRGAKLRLGGFLPGPPNLSVDAAPGPPAAGPPAGAAAAAAEANGPMHGGGPPRGLPAEGPGPGAPPPPGGPPQEPRLPPPEYMSRTLWVGQIPATMRDEEVLRAFSACGEVVGHKFLRHTNCAFIDFSTQAGATEARKRLDGARVGMATFRVEFKNEKQWWAGQAARGERERDVHHPPFRDGPPPPGAPGGSNPRPGPPPPGWGPGQPPQQQLQQQPLPEGPGRPWGPPPPAGGALQGGHPGPPGWPPRGHPGGHGPGLGPQLAASSSLPLPGGPDGQRDLRRLESAMSGAPLATAGSMPPSLPSGSLPSMPLPSGGMPSMPLPSGGLGPAHSMGMQQPLGAHPPGGLPAPAPAAGAPPPAAATPAWHGKLAKSKQPVCSVACLDPPGAAPGGAPVPPGWAAAEPQQWPGVLDVAMRADLAFVCGQLYSAAPPGERAVRRVAPLAEPQHQRAFAEFVSYLEGKSRAGVVKLPPLPGAGGGAAAGRVMYLIPPSDHACAALGVPRDAATDCMLALVLAAAK